MSCFIFETIVFLNNLCWSRGTAIGHEDLDRNFQRTSDSARNQNKPSFLLFPYFIVPKRKRSAAEIWFHLFPYPYFFDLIFQDVARCRREGFRMVSGEILVHFVNVSNWVIVAS
jgi:hypothetical protein